MCDIIIVMHSQKKDIYGLSVVVAILLFFVGYILGLYIQKARYKNFLETFKTVREDVVEKRLISPLVGVISAPATDVGIFSDIQKKVISFATEQKKEGILYDYSFYFRDFNTGLWFGDNEDSVFFPASLFKLPIAIAVYKQGENDATFLSRQVMYTKEIATKNDSNNLNADSGLSIGKSYTVSYLVEKMIVDSDNGAKDMLLTVIDKKYIDSLFKVASSLEPKVVQANAVSSRQYAFFLRMLYGSSYLNEANSELLLEMLTRSTFNDGLVGGLPAGVVVAHKFGVYDFPDDEGKESVELHDCGIIYHPTHPYVLCFLTKGKDVESLFSVISEVSKMVYQYQDKKN